MKLDEKNLITENPRRLLANVNQRLKRMKKYLGDEHDAIQNVKHQLDMVYGFSSIGVPTFRVKGLSDEQIKQVLDIAKTFYASSYSTKTGLKKQMENKGFKTFTKNKSQSEILFWDTVFSSPNWERIKELFYMDSKNATSTAERIEKYGDNPYQLDNIFTAWTNVAKEDKASFRKSVDAVLSKWTHLSEEEKNKTNFADFASSVISNL